MNEPKVALTAYTNEFVTLEGDKIHFDIPWTSLLMLSCVEGRSFVCLTPSDQQLLAYEISHDDYERIYAAWQTKLAGNRLKEFSSISPLQCPEI